MLLYVILAIALLFFHFINNNGTSFLDASQEMEAKVTDASVATVRSRNA